VVLQEGIPGEAQNDVNLKVILRGTIRCYTEKNYPGINEHV